MKITFITGAANGLGTEFARLYAQDNNNLLLVDKDEQGLLAVQQELQQKYPELVVDTFVADLSQTEELKRAYRYTVEKGYFVNNLVNGAGFGDRCDFKDMDIDKQLAMTNVNCNAVLYFTRVFLDNMLAHDEGHIINVASIAAFMPAPYMCTYHATKSFVLLLGEAISYEIRKTKVKLLTLCPGPFLSKFVELAHNDYTFTKIKPITAAKVAQIGYKKSLAGKSLHIIGGGNRLTIFATRFVPRKLTTSISAKNMKKGD